MSTKFYVILNVSKIESYVTFCLNNKAPNHKEWCFNMVFIKTAFGRHIRTGKTGHLMVYTLHIPREIKRTV